MPAYGRRRDITGVGLSSVTANQGRRGILQGSVQNGTVSTSISGTATATITAIDPTNSILFFGWAATTTTNADYQVAGTRITVTNSTTLTTVTFNGSASITSYGVAQYLPGVLRSVQRGSIGLNSGATSGTATITSVDTTRAVCMDLGDGARSSGASEATNVWTHYKTLTNATTVTAVRNSGGTSSTTTVTYQIVEHQ